MLDTARMIVEEVAGIKPGETVCIFTDTKQSKNINESIAECVRAVEAKPVIIVINPTEVGGVEPPASASAAIRASDVVIAHASYAIYHTNTIREALRSGTRLCDMWGVTEDMMLNLGTIADYQNMEKVTRRLAQILTSGKEARMTTKDGTDIVLSLANRQGHSLVGLARNPGEHCSFPSGEAAISPVEGSAKGILVHPFCIEHADLGFIDENIYLKVDEGKVVSIEGETAARRLLNFLKPLGDSAKNIAELGIGTNPRVHPNRNIREAKKALGTVHIGLGNNKSLGGNVDSPLHMDLIFRKPTLVIDCHVLLKEGQLCI